MYEHAYRHMYGLDMSLDAIYRHVPYDTRHHDGRDNGHGDDTLNPSYDQKR